MSGVYSGNYNSAITLSAAITNVTISGTVNAAVTTAETSNLGFTLSTAVYGSAASAFTVENTGLLTSAEASVYDFGIILAAPGRVDNTGTIRDSSGIGIFGTTGYATNSGLIFTSFNSTIVNPEPGIYLSGAGTALNTGTIIASSNGVYMGKDGGTLAGFVSNAATGVISGNVAVDLYTPGATVINAGTVFGGSNGVFIYGEGGYIQNSGSIIGTGAGTPASADGIFLEGSDFIVNGASNVTNAVISGTGLSFGIDIIKPFGSTIASIATVVNYGTIRGGSNPGIGLAAGTIINGTALDTLALVTGIVDPGANALVSNFGTINGNGQIGPALEDYGTGIVLNGATNDTAALIESTAVNNVSLGRNQTLINYGTIAGGVFNGIYAQSGTLSNAATGVVIGGKVGAQVAGYGAETVTNAGLILGTIGLKAVASYSYNDVFTNSGTIASILGNVGTAIAFARGNDLLIDDPGAVFIGTVSGGAGKNTLELAAGSGSITGIGSQFIQFGSINFDTGGTWSAEGDVAGLAAAQTINGFAAGDTIILDGFSENSYTYVSNAGLELNNGASIVTLGITGPFGNTDFAVTTTPNNTTISLSPPCFAEGTRILTETGETRVEDLKLGDHLILANGEICPITWIGKRRIGLTRHPRPETVQPIRIAAGALADGLPARDLILSPDHALYLENHLIPAKALLNGHSIAQLNRLSISYYHIEVTHHAVLLAEGTPAETYLETGNRQAFENSSEAAIILHPDFAQTQRETEGCAPFAEAGPIVERVRSGILDRARISTTNDPALTIRYQNGEAIISSRTAIPGYLTADPRDRRILGVKIATLHISGRPIPLDHPDLTTGWHGLEPDGCWTDGNAIIPASLLKNSNLVLITLAATLAYPLQEPIKNAVKD
jgi:hypothetical protein